jgi:hypothetical protein
MNEQELFDALRDEYYPDLIKVADEYSNFDCVSDREDLYIELKCRHAHYDDLLIEKFKYTNIMEQANICGKIPIYICSTPSGVWEFNLDTIKVKWQDKDNLPKTTEFEDIEKVVKTVGFLPISRGKKLFAENYEAEETDGNDLWSDGEVDFDPNHDDDYSSDGWSSTVSTS